MTNHTDGLDAAGLEALARAYDAEDAFQRGETSPWADEQDSTFPVWRAERLACAEVGLRAYIASVPGRGWQLVPVEPTPDMLTAVGTIEGWNEAASKHADECHIDWWKAMLAASPSPSSPEDGR